MSDDDSEIKPVLVVVEDHYRVRICWDFEDDEGAHLGEDVDPEYLNKTPPEDREEWEGWIANKVASESNPNRDHCYYWESVKEARAVLRGIKERLKQDRELPAWAQTALEQGWKPPKGWKA